MYRIETEIWIIPKSEEFRTYSMFKIRDDKRSYDPTVFPSFCTYPLYSAMVSVDLLFNNIYRIIARVLFTNDFKSSSRHLDTCDLGRTPLLGFNLFLCHMMYKIQIQNPYLFNVWKNQLLAVGREFAYLILTSIICRLIATGSNTVWKRNRGVEKSGAFLESYEIVCYRTQIKFKKKHYVHVLH